MSADSDRPSRFDPRFSSSFQRGGEGQPELPPSPSYFEAVPDSPEGIDGFDAVLDERDRAAVPQPGPGDDAIRYVAGWGWALVAAALAGLLLSVLIQQQVFNTMRSDQQWLYPLFNLLQTTAPWLLVLGIGLVVFAGYKRRAARHAGDGRR